MFFVVCLFVCSFVGLLAFLVCCWLLVLLVLLLLLLLLLMFDVGCWLLFSSSLLSFCMSAGTCQFMETLSNSGIMTTSELLRFLRFAHERQWDDLTPLQESYEPTGSRYELFHGSIGRFYSLGTNFAECSTYWAPPRSISSNQDYYISSIPALTFPCHCHRDIA